MSKRDWDSDRDEIYDNRDKGKKRRGWREQRHHENRVRKFKRDYSLDADREDLEFYDRYK
jgi:hypothetical protein